MINVTKTFLPPFEEYTAVLKRAWDISWITNNGILLRELESKLKEFLSVKHLLFAANGTVVLQMALKALGITREVITTPFSYVASTNVIIWEGCTPIFVDIDQETFCIDANKIEAAITENTQGILATHVYGIPCNIEKIQLIAEKYNLKVIYDGAHAFGCRLNNKSVLSYGDISTCSFHATKVFHTGEGGCIVCNDKALNDKLYLLRSFGHLGDDHYMAGINAKNSEFHAAMGLVNLNYIQAIIEDRKILSKIYDIQLEGLKIDRPLIPDNVEYNYSYYPIVFNSEDELLKTIRILNDESIFPRRYFYPSLNLLPQTRECAAKCPISEDICRRVLCLPLYAGLKAEDVVSITTLIKSIGL